MAVPAYGGQRLRGRRRGRRCRRHGDGLDDDRVTDAVADEKLRLLRGQRRRWAASTHCPPRLELVPSGLQGVGQLAYPGREGTAVNVPWRTPPCSRRRCASRADADRDPRRGPRWPVPIRSDEGVVAAEPRHGGWEFEVTPYLLASRDGMGPSPSAIASADLDIDLGEVLRPARRRRSHRWHGSLRGPQRQARALHRRDGRRHQRRCPRENPARPSGRRRRGRLRHGHGRARAAYRLLEHGRFALEGARRGALHLRLHRGRGCRSARATEAGDASQEFVDPFFGIRGAIRLADQWSFVVRSDVGASGAGSQLAWTVLGGFRWDIPRKLGSAQPSLFAWIQSLRRRLRKRGRRRQTPDRRPAAWTGPSA